MKIISNVSIDSALLHISGDDTPQSITRKVTLNISAGATTTQANYSNLNVRIIAATGNACKPLDFIAQRYNEYYKNGIDNSISSYEYNDFIHSSLKTNKSYLKTANPFSPFSVNIAESEIIFRDGKFVNSDTDPVPNNVVIGDFPVMDLLHKIRNKRLIFNQVNFDLPQQQDDLTSLSLYAFIYTVPEAIPGTISLENTNVFSVNVISTEVAVESVVGLGYYYEEATARNPYVDMSRFTTLNSPAKNKLTILDQRTDIDPRSSVMTLLNRMRKDDVVSNTPYSDKNCYSNLWSSRDDKDRYRIACAFDIKSFLISNGVFPSMYKSERLCKILLGDRTEGTIVAPNEPSHLQSSRLLRRQIDQTALAPENSVSTGGKSIVRGPSDTFPGKDVGPLNEVDGLADLYGGIKFLESATPDSAETGTYQYGVKLLVTDCSLEVMRNFASLFLELEASNGKILNSITNRVRPEDTESLLINLSGLDFLLSLMSSLPELGLREHYSSRMFSGDVKNQIDILEEVRRLFSLVVSDIMDRLRKVSPGNPLGIVSNTGTKAMKMGQNRTSRSLVQTSTYYFPKIISTSKSFRYGVDYVISKNTSESGIESINIGDYILRRNEEFSKYFEPIIGNNPEPPESGFFSDAAYSYMTPKTIRTPERELINQPSVKSERDAISYDYDRYAQLFTDIINVSLQDKDLDISPSLTKKPNNRKDSGFVYNSTLDLLSAKFGVHIKDVAKPQFSVSKVVTGRIQSSVIDPADTGNCDNSDSDRLIPSIIGGNQSPQITTTSLINSINSKILAQDKSQLKGYTVTTQKEKTSRIGTVKIPFAILGELALNPEMETYDSGYNSLTRLKNFLNVASDQVNEVFTEPFVASLPNQIKSMIAIAGTNERETLGLTSDNTQYSSTRPVLLDSEKSDDLEQMISYYGKNEEIPPYPKTLDPMKTYSKFLAFWMNYKQIGVVEYLDGFEDVLSSNTESPSTLRRLKLPIWKKLDAAKGGELQNQTTKLLCRVRAMSSEDYVSLAADEYSEEDKVEIAKIFETKEILNLPSYNQYFYIQGTAPQGTQETVVSQEMQQMQEMTGNLDYG